MKEIIFTDDKYQMNWLRPDFEYGQVLCPEDLTVNAEHTKKGDCYHTRITISNQSDKPFFTSVDSVGIRFPLEDKYESSDICISRRCNTHIFCGGDVSYILGLRMGGEAPHLGMILTEGSLECYSVERDLSKRSNDRGCFILHPSPMELNPGESFVIGWKVFPHQGKEDFRRELEAARRYIKVEADSYVLFQGEQARLRITPAFPAKQVLVNGKEMTEKQGDSYLVVWETENLGEEKIFICVDGICTWCRIFIQEKPEKLAKKRCQFLVHRQQYRGKYPGLYGAFLIYDNEEKHMYYNRKNDYNGGRERVAMGILLARYMQKNKDGSLFQKELENSLKDYMNYVRTALVNRETGEVCNDMVLDNRYQRLYNFPWFVTFFAEYYKLTGEEEALKDGFKIYEEFYRRGGADFYPIELPILMLYQLFSDKGAEYPCRIILENSVLHADNILETGLHYPASEVNYEQSIVAPAANVLLQAYVLTGNEKYREAGELQIKVLEQFNGIQPDYHLYETAIRHWDGYWFGKRQIYGDTFPHYWSGLTGVVFELYAQVSGREDYEKKAEDSLRGVLPLFFADGSASCAYVYPRRVNGELADFYDPYANDQDWGLYFYLRHMDGDLDNIYDCFSHKREKGK